MGYYAALVLYQNNEDFKAILEGLGYSTNLSQTNPYVYAINNPVNQIDPLGLWSLSISGYPGLGGGITIGWNPGGGLFLTLRGGIGLGGGIGFDPFGTSPGWEPCPKHGSSLGAYSEIGFGLGPLKWSWSGRTGYKYFGGLDLQKYYNPPNLYGRGSARGSWKFGVGGSAGGEISFF